MIVRRISVIAVLLGCFSLISCVQPVQNDIPDQKELVSVWQYLKAYSIYQPPFSDKIPENPFVYNSPQKLLDQIGDTLKGNYYTEYIDEADHRITPFEKLHKSAANQNAVKFDSLTDSCCLLTISSFLDDSANIIYDEFKALFPRLNRFSKIIFDVQNDGGGDLSTTDSIIEDVLPAGIRYLRALERVYNPSTRTASTIDSIWETKRPANSAFANKKFAVLINEWSASASEIFAIALKDGLAAPLFGVKSYGKAIGQIHLSRRGRNILKITYAHFFRITNLEKNTYKDYHREGISPDVVTDRPLYYAVKYLQPSVPDSKINYPLSKRTSSFATSEIGLFKKVDESELQ